MATSRRRSVVLLRLLVLLCGAALPLPRPAQGAAPQLSNDAASIDADQSPPALSTDAANHPATTDLLAADLEVASRIDELLTARMTAEGLQPGPAATDAEFPRRVWLDLAGVIPSPHEVLQFLDDSAADKRGRLIEQLLASPRHALHLTNLWRDALLPDSETQLDPRETIAFQAWLRRQFLEHRRYDHLVADLLVTNGSAREGDPVLFYTSRQIQPAELAASTAQVFLGVQLQCAQCHDHPFDRWTQSDFWGYAAFFARVRRGADDAGLALLSDDRTGDVRLPDSETIVEPRYLLGDQAPDESDHNRRRQLAIWLVSRDNPYLARAAVNRAWSHLFGRGLVTPIDDLGEHNPATHPEVLDLLAEHFTTRGFDLRALYRTIASTDAYQRTSRREAPRELAGESATGDAEPVDRAEAAVRWYARMPVRPLSADALYDSLGRATLGRVGAPGMVNLAALPMADEPRAQFLARFRSPPQSGLDDQLGIPQALSLMNGALVESVTASDSGQLLAALQAPFLDDDERIDTLYLATLSRRPDDRERSLCRQALAGGHDASALGDLLWSLLNCAEFRLNH